MKSINEEIRNVYDICCEKLAVEAVKKLSADNVTVVIISIESIQ